MKALQVGLSLLVVGCAASATLPGAGPATEKPSGAPPVAAQPVPTQPVPTQPVSTQPVAVQASAAAPRPGAAAASSTLPPDAEVQRILAQRVGEHAAQYGIVVGLLDANGPRIVSHGSFDRDTPRAVDGNTLFELGSISKVFTALLLQLSVERGEVALDDPLAQHLPPGTKVPAFNGKPITLRHLATHTSGLPRSPTNLTVQDPDDPYARYTVENLYELLASYQLTREPGSKYQYSNLGAAVLARALIVRTGKSYAQLVQERIAAPLGLQHTWVDVPEAERARLATGHTQSLRKAPFRTRIAMIGNGGVFSSASDLLTFLSASMGLSDTPLKHAFQQLARPQRPLDHDGDAVGLGWHLTKAAEGSVVWHDGGTAGFRTVAGYVPERRVAVVVLSNLETPGGVDDLGMFLLAGGPLHPPGTAAVSPRPALAVASQVLERYVGDYRLGTSPVFRVRLEGGELRVTIDDKTTLKLLAESETAFFGDAGITFRFEPASGGKAPAVVMGHKGKELRLPRLEVATAGSSKALAGSSKAAPAPKATPAAKRALPE